MAESLEEEFKRLIGNHVAFQGCDLADWQKLTQAPMEDALKGLPVKLKTRLIDLWRRGGVLPLLHVFSAIR